MAKKKKNVLQDTLEKISNSRLTALLKIYQEYISRIEKGDVLKLSEKKHFDALHNQLEMILGDKPKDRFSSKEAMERLGIDSRMLSYHTTRGNLQKNSDGTYSLEILQGFEKKYKRRRAGVKGASVADKQDRADLRFRLARARREEMLVKQTKNELIPTEEMAKEWGKRLNTLFLGIKLWTNRLSPRLEGKTRDEMMVIFEDEIYLLMKTFAEKGRYCPEIDGAIYLKK